MKAGEGDDRGWMVGWHHGLNGHEFEQTQGDGEGQGSLVGCRVAKNQTRLSSSVVLVAQSCPTLCNPVDWSLPGSSVHRILQARILEWAAIFSSRGSSQARDRTQVSCIVGRLY